MSKPCTAPQEIEVRRCGLAGGAGGGRAGEHLHGVSSDESSEVSSRNLA